MPFINIRVLYLSDASLSCPQVRFKHFCSRRRRIAFLGLAVHVVEHPPLVRLWQNPLSIRNDDIVDMKLVQEARLWRLVAAGDSLWAVLNAPHASHRLPGRSAQTTHQPDASLATGPFTGGCQARRGGGLLRACPKAKGARGPQERGFCPLSDWDQRQTSGCADLKLRASLWRRGFIGADPQNEERAPRRSTCARNLPNSSRPQHGSMRNGNVGKSATKINRQTKTHWRILVAADINRY